jgi:hypothetical protein
MQVGRRKDDLTWDLERSFNPLVRLGVGCVVSSRKAGRGRCCRAREAVARYPPALVLSLRYATAARSKSGESRK